MSTDVPSSLALPTSGGSPDRKGPTDGSTPLVMDVIGRIGEDPGSYWGTEPTTTQDHTLIRKCDVFTGDPIGDDPFDPADEWLSYPQDNIDYLTFLTYACWWWYYYPY